MTVSPADQPDAEKAGPVQSDSAQSGPEREAVGAIVVRYWAAARAAAGVESDRLPATGPVPLTDVLTEARRLHADSARFGDVVAVCSVLVGERPVGSADPAQVLVRPGDTVELLPPFAGG